MNGNIVALSEKKCENKVKNAHLPNFSYEWNLGGIYVVMVEPKHTPYCECHWIIIEIPMMNIRESLYVNDSFVRFWKRQRWRCLAPDKRRYYLVMKTKVEA